MYSLFKNRTGLRVKSVALFLCQTLLFLPVTSVTANTGSNVKVNRQYGKVVASHRTDDSDFKVIHIKDAHCLLEAQLNISEILKDILTDSNIKIIGLEGACGGFDTGYFAKYPEKNVLRKVTKHFIKKGKLCGAEYYSINENNPDVLLGVEEKDLYVQNYNEFLKSLSVRESALKYFDKADENLGLISESCQSDVIREFNSKFMVLRQSQKDFVGFCTLLSRYSKENNVVTDSLDHFNMFLSAVELEKSIQFEKVNPEKTSLIDKLSETLSQKELTQLLQKNLHFKINKINPSEYYGFLKEKAEQSGVDYSDYPNFIAYTKYLLNYDGINQRDLFVETDKLLSQIREKISVTEDDKQINRLIVSNDLLKKYTTLNLSTMELSKLKGDGVMDIKEFDLAMSSYCRCLNLACAGMTALLQTIVEGMPLLESYYKTAKKRDSAMVEKLIAEMDLEGVNTAVLIAGGFHTEGVMANLKKKGVNYDVIAPEITKEQDSNPYYSLMTNIRTPFEDLLASHTLAISANTAKLNLLDQQNQSVFIKEIDSALVAMTADLEENQFLSEVEMLDKINEMLFSQYDNRYNVKVLGRSVALGQKGFRAYLLKIGEGEFTFVVQDKMQDSFESSNVLAFHKIEDKKITIATAREFDFMIKNRDVLAQTLEDYRYVVSSEFRQRKTYKAIDDLLAVLVDDGVVTTNEQRKLFIEDLDVKGKRVLIRVDFNVPLDSSQNVTDDTRIRAVLDTINYVTKNGGKAVLMSHLGRPKGNVVEELRIKPAGDRLAELLGKPVKILSECTGQEVEDAVNAMADGDVVLLENLRFHSEETENDPEFAKKLASLGDVYINDAFGTAHRAHASTAGVTEYFDQAACGYLLKKEIDYLGNTLQSPEKPFIAIIGGAKISGKIDVITSLLDKVDSLLIGGGMAYTFLKAMGYEIGTSIVELDKVEVAKQILAKAEKMGVEIVLPVDIVVSDEVSPDAKTDIVDADKIVPTKGGADIGPKTRKLFQEKIASARTVLWNGPVGVFELDPFSEGTNSIARTLAESSAVTIIGGGDSVAAINKLNLADKMTHISTGGGASLEYLEGKKLPGIESLSDVRIGITDSLGVDVKSDIDGYLSYFVDRGLIFVSDGLEQGEKVYSFFESGMHKNMSAFARMPRSKIVPAEDVSFPVSMSTDNNLQTSGNIKLYYLEEGLPNDVLLKLLAEVYAGRTELFNSVNPGSVEIASTNGNIYEINVIYRDQDKGYFVRVELKEAPAVPLPKFIELGMAFNNSPVVKNQSYIPVVAKTPFDFDTVGVPKFYVEMDEKTNVARLHVTVLEYNKLTQNIEGEIRNLSAHVDLVDATSLGDQFSEVVADLLKGAQAESVGLLSPVLDDFLTDRLSPSDIKKSLMLRGASYLPVKTCDVSFNLKQNRFDFKLNKNDIVNSIPQVFNDFIEVMYGLADRHVVDRFIKNGDKAGLVDLFQQTAEPMIKNILSLVASQYGIEDNNIDLEIDIAAGVMATAHKDQIGIKLTMNMDAFLSRGLLFGLMEHEIRHEVIGEHAEAAMKRLSEARGIEYKKYYTDVLAELYISMKEIDRYRQFGIEPDLGTKTRRALLSEKTSIDTGGEFYPLLDMSEDKLFEKLLAIVAGTYFPNLESFLDAGLMKTALNDLKASLSTDELGGDFNIHLNKENMIALWSEDNQKESVEYAGTLANTKAVTILHPETVKLSKNVKVGYLSGIGLDTVILGDGINIGRKVDIGNGVKIISDGGTVNIMEGAKIGDGTVIRAKVGETIIVGPGTIVMRGAELSGNIHIGEGAVIDGSKIKNAYIHSTTDNPTKIIDSEVWGETSADENLVKIGDGVTILYSKIVTEEVKESVDFLEGYDGEFRNLFDSDKYTMEFSETFIKSGATIEKAEIVNSEIGENTNVLSHSKVSHSIVKNDAQVRTGTKITLSYFGRTADIGSDTNRSYFGDGAKSEHRGTKIENVFVPNEYIIADENGDLKKIIVPNTTNIGAGTIFENNINRPIIGYAMFTAINSKVVNPEDSSTFMFPFTLTKNEVGGFMLPFAFSQKTGVTVDSWMLNSYSGAMVNHYKKGLSAAEKLGYDLSDYDQLYVGTLRLSLKMIDKKIAIIEATDTDKKDSQLKELNRIKKTFMEHLYSGAWNMKNGALVNGAFKWSRGDKWGTDNLKKFQQMSLEEIEAFSKNYSFLEENHVAHEDYVNPELVSRAVMGTDGVRGVAHNVNAIDGKYVTSAMGYRLGIVAALHAVYTGKNAIYIGGDTRDSRDYLIPAVAWGARSMGVDVFHTESFIDHTPGLQYKINKDDLAGAGIVVTASHNPHQDNGFKLLNDKGDKISSEWESISNRILNAGDLNHELALVIQELGGRDQFSAMFENIAQKHAGDQKIAGDNIEKDYIDELVDAMRDIIPSDGKRREFYIGASNGASGRILRTIVERLRSELNIKINVLNDINVTKGKINDQVGAEYFHKKLSKEIAAGKPVPAWMDDLRGIRIGVLDGDGDRNLDFVLDAENNLQLVDGDKIAALKALAINGLINKLGLQNDFQVGIGQTVLANLGSKEFYKEKGLHNMETAVGDKYVRKAAADWAFGVSEQNLPAHGVAVYYEAAGHGSILFSEDFINSVNAVEDSEDKKLLQGIIKMTNEAGGDGIRNLLLYLALSERLGYSFDDLNSSDVFYEDVPKIELEFKVQDKTVVKSVDDLGVELTGPSDIMQFVSDIKQRLMNELDAMIDSGQVRREDLIANEFSIIVRASGTSPKMRVQVDGPYFNLIEKAAYEIAQEIYDNPSIVGIEDKSPKQKYDEIVAFQKREAGQKLIAEYSDNNLQRLVQEVNEKFKEDEVYKPLEVIGEPKVGTDGIRGLASLEQILDEKKITPPLAYRMGIVAGLKALSKGRTTIHVAGDTRESTDYLMDSFIAGAQQIGVVVIKNGMYSIMSTPQLQNIVLNDPKAGAGAVITASHNHFEDNGIKLLDAMGGKIDAHWEELTNQVINTSDLAGMIAKIISTFGEPNLVENRVDEFKINQALDLLGKKSLLKSDISPSKEGAYSEETKKYVDRVIVSMLRLDDMRQLGADKSSKSRLGTFYVDAANGAGSEAMKQIVDIINGFFNNGKISFRMELINSGEGRINDDVGAEFIHKDLADELATGKPLPSWIEGLKSQWVGTLDGDADRNLFFSVDEDNNVQVVDGDKFCALKAMVLNKYIKQLGLDDKFGVGVAQTVLANLGSKGFYERKGIDVAETEVGDKYVRSAAMDFAYGNEEKGIKPHGVSVYYEAAGHGSIVFSEDFRKALSEVRPSSPITQIAKSLLLEIMKLQNEAGGDGIMNLMLFRMLMDIENISFKQLDQDEFLYKDLPKEELKIKVKYKENLTSVGDFGLELTGPADLIDVVERVKENLNAEIDKKVDAGEIDRKDVPSTPFRIVVRASGTSPYARVQVDGIDAELASKAAYQILQAMYESPNLVGDDSFVPMERYKLKLQEEKNKLLGKLTVTPEDGAEYINGWDVLSEEERTDVLLDLTNNGITSDMLPKLIGIHTKGGETAVTPPDVAVSYETPEMIDISRGTDGREDIIKRGTDKKLVDRSAMVIVAGGDGSRLLSSMGFTDQEKAEFSKPTIPVTAVANKPPLQRILENIVKIREAQESNIPVVMVVGPKSRKPIETFLAKHNNFGMDNVVIVEQGKFPVLRVMEDGATPKIMLDAQRQVVYNPDGTGGIIDCMGNQVTVSDQEFDSVVDYLDSLNRDKLLFWSGDVSDFSDDLFYGFLGSSINYEENYDMDAVGFAYHTQNQKLGTFVVMDGKVLHIVEGNDRDKFVGLEDADDISGDKAGLPRNSGQYLVSLKDIKGLIGKFPVHLQVDKDIDAVDPETGRKITKGDKMEKYFPDIFPILSRNLGAKMTILIADETVPTKSVPQLLLAKLGLVKADKETLAGFISATSSYLGADGTSLAIGEMPMSIDESAMVEISHLINPNNIGYGIKVGQGVHLYMGKDFKVRNQVVFGANTLVKGENVYLGDRVVIEEGSSIEVEDGGRLIILDDTVVSGSTITVKAGETVVIGKDSKILNNTSISGDAAIGDGVKLSNARVSHAEIYQGASIDDSTVRGLQDIPIIVGHNVTISDKSVLSNEKKTKKWSFVEGRDINTDFSPSTDDTVIRRYKIDSSRTIIGDGTQIRNARVINTKIGEETDIRSGVFIEHSIVGNNTKIFEGSSITISYFGNNVRVSSEVSKSYFGDYSNVSGKVTYSSAIVPNEFIIVNEQGEIEVIDVPNVTDISGSYFANYGGKPLPDASGSLKGTAFVFCSKIENANVINMYDHPDIHLGDLISEPNVTVLYPFSYVPGGEVWGTVFPFTIADSLSPSKHKIGGVLKEKVGMITEMVENIRLALPEGKKDLADKIVEGSLRLGIKLVNDAIEGTNKILKTAKPYQIDKLEKRIEQLKAGRDIYQSELNRGVWKKPGDIDLSAIGMSNYDQKRSSIEYVRLFGNPNIVSLEPEIIDQMIEDKQAVAEMQSILKDIESTMSDEERADYRKAVAGTIKEQVRFFTKISRDRVKQVRDLLGSQYRGVEKLIFVVALGTERLAQRHVKDNRIVINANALRSPLLMLSQAEHELFHEIVEHTINDAVDSSPLKTKKIVEAILTEKVKPEDNLTEVSEKFFAKLKEFLKEDFIISKEIDRIISLKEDEYDGILNIFKDPSNPIDKGNKFADLISQVKSDPQVKRETIKNFILNNYDGMDILRDNLPDILMFKNKVALGDIKTMSLDDFDIIAQIETGLTNAGKTFDGKRGDGLGAFYESLLVSNKINDSFLPSLDERGRIVATDISHSDAARLDDEALAMVSYEVAAIDFDVFGETMMTDTNSLFFADALKKIRENSEQNGNKSKIVIFSLRKNADEMRRFLVFHNVDLASVEIIDRNDVFNRLDSIVKTDDSYQSVYNIFKNAIEQNDFSAIDKLYDQILLGDQDAIEFGNKLVKLLYEQFKVSIELSNLTFADFKFVASKKGLVQSAINNNLRTVHWDSIGSEVVREGDLIETGLDNLLLLQVLEPGSEVPRNLIVSAVAKGKSINGVNVYDLFIKEQATRKKQDSKIPITIEDLVSMAGLDYLLKEDIEGIAVKAPKRKVDREFMDNLKQQRLFDQAA